MNTFLERHELLKLTQEDTKYLTRTITSKNVDLMKTLLTKRSRDPDNCAAKFYQIFKEALTLIIYKLFQNIEEERTHSDSFYKVRITLIQKYRQRYHTKKDNRTISLTNINVKSSTKY